MQLMYTNDGSWKNRTLFGLSYWLFEYIPNSDSKTQWIFQNAKSTIPAPPPSLTVLEPFAFI